jgi:hypothetical protein
MTLHPHLGGEAFHSPPAAALAELGDDGAA